MRRALVSVFLVLTIALGSLGAASAQDSYPQPGNPVSNAVVQNMTTTAGKTALVTAVYYSSSGNPVHTNDKIQIAPKAVKEIKTADEPLGDGFQGSAILSSSEPLAAIVSIQYKNVPGDTGDPNRQTQAAYNATSEASSVLYFPSVWRFDGIVARLSVQNTSPQDAIVKLTFKKRDGTAAGVLDNVTIKAYGQRTFYLGNSSDVPADLPSDFRDGSVTVESTNGKLLAGAAAITWPNRAAGYKALSDSSKGKVLYAPSHFRFISNATGSSKDLPANQWNLFTALNLQNTSATATANVKLTYTARGASTPSLVKNITIPPLSAKGLNTQNGGDYPKTDFNALSSNADGRPDWAGSVLIESDQDLVGTNITNWGDKGYAGIYALAAPNEGKNVLFLPAQYRRHDANGWAQWSAINLQNVGDNTIAESDLKIEYIDQNGNSIKTFTGSALNPATGGNGLAKGEAIGLNTRNGGDLDASVFNSFPTSDGVPNFIGGIYVEAPAGSKLVAVGNIVYNNRASVYNGVPK